MSKKARYDDPERYILSRSISGHGAVLPADAVRVLAMGMVLRQNQLKRMLDVIEAHDIDLEAEFAKLDEAALAEEVADKPMDEAEIEAELAKIQAEGEDAAADA